MAACKAEVSEAEFSHWREYMRREPCAADRLEFWLSWLVTNHLNVNRKADGRAYTPDEVREAGVGLADMLPDRWRVGSAKRRGDRLSGPAMAEGLKAWAGGCG